MRAVSIRFFAQPTAPLRLALSYRRSLLKEGNTNLGWNVLWIQIQGLGQVCRPPSSGFDPFRVIWQLRIDELNQPVPSSGCGELGDEILHPLLFRSDLTRHKGGLSLSRRRRQAQDRNAIPGAIALDRLDTSVKEHQLIESHRGDMKWSEIPPQARVDAMASVRIEVDHTNREELLQPVIAIRFST